MGDYQFKRSDLIDELDKKKELEAAQSLALTPMEPGYFSDQLNTPEPLSSNAQSISSLEEPKDQSSNNSRLTKAGFEALAGLGKSMSRGQDIPAMPKLNPLKTIDPQDIMEARRKALMQLSVRKK